MLYVVVRLCTPVFTSSGLAAGSSVRRLSIAPSRPAAHYVDPSGVAAAVCVSYRRLLGCWYSCTRVEVSWFATCSRRFAGWLDSSLLTLLQVCSYCDVDEQMLILRSYIFCVWEYRNIDSWICYLDVKSTPCSFVFFRLVVLLLLLFHFIILMAAIKFSFGVFAFLKHYNII